MTTTRAWWCSRAGRSRSTHPKMSPISARPPCGDCCGAHRPRTRGASSLIDVDDWASADVAVAEMASRDESQLALRDGVCFAPRLVRTERIEGAELVEAGTWRLATLGNGTLDSRNFALRPWPESKRPLEPGQVRLGLRCTGVNFRDVLIALGDPADVRRRPRRFRRRSRGRRRCARSSRRATV